MGVVVMALRRAFAQQVLGQPLLRTASVHRPTIRCMSQQGAAESHKFDPLDAHRRRLIYRSKQRGWLELDIIMGDWSSNNLAAMTKENPDMFKWLTGQIPVP